MDGERLHCRARTPLDHKRLQCLYYHIHSHLCWKSLSPLSSQTGAFLWDGAEGIIQEDNLQLEVMLSNQVVVNDCTTPFLNSTVILSPRAFSLTLTWPLTCRGALLANCVRSKFCELSCWLLLALFTGCLRPLMKNGWRCTTHNAASRGRERYRSASGTPGRAHEGERGVRPTRKAPGSDAVARSLLALLLAQEPARRGSS